MGFIRGSVFVILSVLFLLSLLVGNSFFMISESLEYETVKPEFILAVKSFANQENGINIKNQIDFNFELMQEYCIPNSEFALNIGEDSFVISCDIIAQGEEEVVNYISSQGELNQDFISGTVNANYALMQGSCKEDKEFVFSEGDYAFNIPCLVVLQGNDAIIDYGVENLVDTIYYKDYNCSFIDCFDKIFPPTFLISEKTMNYFNEKFYYFLGISIILAISMLLVSSNRIGWFFVAGVLIIIASLPFMKINWIVGLIPESPFASLIGLFFIKSYNIFIFGLITGFIFIGLGVIIKFFVIGFKVKNFIEWFKKRMKKNKVSKKKDLIKGKKGEFVIEE